MQTNWNLSVKWDWNSWLSWIMTDTSRMCRANMLQQGGQTETDVWDLKLCSLISCSLWEMSSHFLLQNVWDLFWEELMESVLEFQRENTAELSWRALMRQWSGNGSVSQPLRLASVTQSWILRKTFLLVFLIQSIQQRSLVSLHFSKPDDHSFFRGNSLQLMSQVLNKNQHLISKRSFTSSPWAFRKAQLKVNFSFHWHTFLRVSLFLSDNRLLCCFWTALPGCCHSFFFSDPPTVRQLFIRKHYPEDFAWVSVFRINTKETKSSGVTLCLKKTCRFFQNIPSCQVSVRDGRCHIFKIHYWLPFA